MIVNLNHVRLAFPDLFDVDTYPYRATFLMPADSNERKACDEAIAQVAVENWGEAATQQLEAIKNNPNKCCFNDGDKKLYKGFAGNWALSTSSSVESMPEIKGSRDELRAGCYVNASVDIYVQDPFDYPRIKARLCSIQFIKGGEPFLDITSTCYPKS